MKRKQLLYKTCIFLILFLFASVGSYVLADNQKIKDNWLKDFTLEARKILVPFNYLIVFLNQVLTIESTAQNEEIKEKPKEEKPVRIITTIRLSERD